MCILSRKHLSVPPGLGQRQQSLSLTFSVFFSAARSQVLPPFFFFSRLFFDTEKHCDIITILIFE